MKYKAVIFDLFGTLIENMTDEDYRIILEDITRTLSTDRERFIEAWLEYTSERMTGAHTNEDSLDIVCRRLEMSIEPDIISSVKTILDNPVETRLKNPGRAGGIIDELRNRGYMTGLASNCSWEVPPLWAASPFQGMIEKPVFSCSSGYQKPEASIYLLAAELHGVSPDECLFVDDSHTALRGAAAVGMMPVNIRDSALRSYANNGETWHGHIIESLEDIIGLVNNLDQ